MSSRALPRSSLAALCAGGFLASLWALFQWGELLVTRAGGTPFCALDGTFDCAAVWDSTFAKRVHSITQVPIAGWGLIWGVIAFLLPLLSLGRGLQIRGLAAALRLTAIVGVVSIGALAVASFVAGAVCIGCIGTYVVVAGWSVLAFLATKSIGFADAQRGIFLAGAVTLGAYLVLLVPGTRTPHALADIGKHAIAQAANAKGSEVKSAPGTGARGPFYGPSTGDPAKDAALEQLLEQLPQDAKQMMSDLLGAYDDAPLSTILPPTRSVSGTSGASVRIVDWTDPLCPHCAELHDILDEIIKVAPDSISVESHFFPLDGLCNPDVERKNEFGEVRCAATKALLCLEADASELGSRSLGKDFHLGRKIVFENQRDLTMKKLWQLLAPLTEKKALEACMTSPAMQRNLDDDIAAASANHIDGTPLVLLNGKAVKPFGPILYALALTGGKTKTAAFRSLLPPRPLPAHEH